ATVWISQVEQLLLLSRVSLHIKQHIRQKQRNVIKYQHLMKILMLKIGSQLNDLLLSSMIEAETCTTEKIPTDSDNFSDIRRYDLVYKINIVTLPITSLKKTSRWRP
ncbi:unnamed protein product, partial [Acanthoscelides obtectus]